MKIVHLGFIFLLIALINTFETIGQIQHAYNPDSMMIRIAEIEIDSNYFDDYLEILKEESEASVRLEAGVISIYPMFEKEQPTKIRILEIYADKLAYKSHLKTPHFKKYKKETQKMVKALKLVEMETIDPTAMGMIFKKLE